MSTIHSSPMHFLPPSAVATSTGQLLTSTDNAGNTAWENPAIPVLPPNSIQYFSLKRLVAILQAMGAIQILTPP